RRAHGGAEDTERDTGNDALPHCARRLGRGPEPLVWSSRARAWDADGKPEPHGARGADRVLREHASTAARPVGQSDGYGAAYAGEGAGARSAAASGCAVRAGRRADAAGTELGTSSGVPGSPGVAECAAGPAAAAGARGAWRRGRRGSDGEVRSDAESRRAGWPDRGG